MLFFRFSNLRFHGALRVKQMQIYGFSYLTKTCILLAVYIFIAAETNRVVAQAVVPHPWMAKAPGEFVRLIDRGNVKIVVDDDHVQKAGKTALTAFQFVIDYDFKFRHQLLGFDNQSQVWQANIVAWMDQPKVKLDHKIYLHSTFSPSSPWESKLLRHEFDHVAISTDPRLLKIIKRALQQRRQWVGKWEQASAPSEKDIRESILETLRSDVISLEQLVQSQYDVLDKESFQGLSEINIRTDFFRRLYTVEGLNQCNYEMDDTMREYVKERLSTPSSQKEVEGHYLFLTP